MWWNRASKGAEEKKQMKEYKNSEIINIINEYVHNERNRLILKRRLVDGICYEPLAEEFGISVRHVKTIVYKEQDRVFRHLD